MSSLKDLADLALSVPGSSASSHDEEPRSRKHHSTGSGMDIFIFGEGFLPTSTEEDEDEDEGFLPTSTEEDEDKVDEKGFLPTSTEEDKVDKVDEKGFIPTSTEEDKDEEKGFLPTSTEEDKDEVDDEVRCCSSNMYNRPYKKLRGTATERGWLETMIRMGVACGVFYLSRRATRSDCDPNQHRFQLTKTDIDKSPDSMKDLAKTAREGVVPVKVLDREGRKYDMIFKFLVTSDTYRFMGSDYTKFLYNTKLAPCQIMDVWGLPIENGGESWLAFLVSDESAVEVVGDGEGDEGGKHRRKLPLLKRWNVQL